MPGRPLVLAILLVLESGRAAPGQEVAVAVGHLHPVGSRESTYSWQFGYHQPLSATWGASFAWLNEVHLPDHHRDGAAVLAGLAFAW